MERLAKKMYQAWVKKYHLQDVYAFDELPAPERARLLFETSFIREEIIRKFKDAFLNKEDLADHRSGCWVIRKIKSLK